MWSYFWQNSWKQYFIYWFPGLSSSRNNSCYPVTLITLKPPLWSPNQEASLKLHILSSSLVLSVAISERFFSAAKRLCVLLLCDSGSTRRLSIPSTYQWHWPCWSREFETEQPSTRPEKHCCVGLICSAFRPCFVGPIFMSWDGGKRIWPFEIGWGDLWQSDIIKTAWNIIQYLEWLPSLRWCQKLQLSSSKGDGYLLPGEAGHFSGV